MVKALKNGKVSSNKKNLKQSLSTIIPPSTSHFARSISSFCRLVLNIEKDLHEPHWQMLPTPNQIQAANDLPLTITNKPIRSKLKLDPVKPNARYGISLKCLDLFLDDLEDAKFPNPTFAWSLPWDSHWNKIFSVFVLKHWQHAYSSGGLINFPINPSHNTLSNATMVLQRWFISKSHDIQLQKYTPEALAKKYYQVKKSKWRRKVSFLTPKLNITIFHFTEVISILLAFRNSHRNAQSIGHTR